MLNCSQFVDRFIVIQKKRRSLYVLSLIYQIQIFQRAVNFCLDMVTVLCLYVRVLYHDVAANIFFSSFLRQRIARWESCITAQC